MTRKKSICILSFSEIGRDARILRQIEYLTPHYNLTVIGGEPRPTAFPNINWFPITVSLPLPQKLLGLFWLLLGWIKLHYYEKWYWYRKHHQQALKIALATHHDAYHANDWHTLPVAAEAARHHNARLIADLHEYAPLEWENRLFWYLFISPMSVYMLRKYGQVADRSITVAEPIAERYRKNFDLDPIVVLNAPKLINVPDHHLESDHIRLIHHGMAIPDRHLEKMVEALALTDNRFSLHFMLIQHHDGYINDLKKVAERIAPGRVHFHSAVPPSQIVKRISTYDIGFYLLEPNSYNNLVALPNKFFDFLAAGLAVCIGPSPAMSEIIRQYGCGCIASSFEPKAVAQTLNQLDVDKLHQMRQAARTAAKSLNAEVEMKKVTKLYQELLFKGVD